MSPLLSQVGFLDKGEIFALVMLQVGLVQLLPKWCPDVVEPGMGEITCMISEGK